jgi:hypothetical protein
MPTDRHNQSLMITVTVGLLNMELTVKLRSMLESLCPSCSIGPSQPPREQPLSRKTTPTQAGSSLSLGS